MSLLKRIQYNSPVILTYVFLSFAIVILGNLTQGQSTTLLFSVYRGEWTDPLMYFRLFGHVLGHADFAHYFNNIMLILLVGPMLEEKYGWKKLLFTIMVTALLTGLINVIFFDTVLLGASGVVFMMILLSSFVNLEKGKIPITLILILFVFVGREVYDGINSEDNISQISHIVGGLCGAVLGYFINTHRLVKKAELAPEKAEIKKPETAEEKFD